MAVTVQEGLLLSLQKKLIKLKDLKSDQTESVLGYPSKSEIVLQRRYGEVMMNKYPNKYWFKRSKTASRNLNGVSIKGETRVLETHSRGII